MAKFTKLNIGDAVASSGGRVWKKLSVESGGELPAVGTSLEDCTWEQISAISAAGKGEEYFKVGDTKSVYLKGTVGTVELDTTLYVYIIGFNHNSELEGEGIHFGTFKSAASEGTDIGLYHSTFLNRTTDGTKNFNMNHWGLVNYGGWAGSDIRYDILGSTDKAPLNYGSKKTASVVGYDASSTCATNPVPNTLMAALPADLRAVMKPMTKYSDNTGGSQTTEAQVTATIDYLPLLAEFEIFGKRGSANEYEQNKQKQYAYYAAGNSTTKAPHSGVKGGVCWLGRSCRSILGSYFCCVMDGRTSMVTADLPSMIAPIFKV